MTVSNGDYIRVQSVLNLGAAKGMNSFLFRADLDADMTDASFMSALETELDTLYFEIGAEESTQVSGDSVTAYKVHWNPLTKTEIVDAVIGDVAWSHVGAAAGGMLPSGVAALVKFATSALKTRLKKYIGGLGETSYENGAFDAGALAALADWAAGLLAGLVLAAGKELVYGAFSTLTDAFQPATTASINTEASYQRRRRTGVGM